MNITAILNIIGHVMKYEIILLLIPFFVALFMDKEMLMHFYIPYY